MARTHRELDTWRLANQLRERIYRFTSTPHVRWDADYCRQIRKAINSVCNNTSEGFYKFKHPLFASALRIARGEIGEVSDQLENARDTGYLDAAEHRELNDLCQQALKTNGGLLRYLEGRPKKSPEDTALTEGPLSNKPKRPAKPKPRKANPG